MHFTFPFNLIPFAPTMVMVGTSILRVADISGPLVKSFSGVLCMLHPCLESQQPLDFEPRPFFTFKSIHPLSLAGCQASAGHCQVQPGYKDSRPQPCPVGHPRAGGREDRCEQAFKCSEVTARTVPPWAQLPAGSQGS